MAFACIFTDAHADRRPMTALGGWTAGLNLPWRRRLVRVTCPGAGTGWAALLPGGLPPPRLARTVAWLARQGATRVTFSPAFGAARPGLALWMAATLRAALLLAAARGVPRRALVVGAGTLPGRMAAGWLAPRVRHLAVGDLPGPQHRVVGERLLDDLGLALTWEPVHWPGPPWKGDLVVWAGGAETPARAVQAPVWLAVGPGRGRPGGDGRERVVVDALLAGVEMKAVPAWWWTRWGWPEGLLPAGGLEALLPPCTGGGVDPGRHLDAIWEAARGRGWSLVGAVLAGAGNRVAWLTGPGGAHIIGDAVG